MALTQACIVGEVDDHDFQPNKFWPWKCGHCQRTFDVHSRVTEAEIAMAVSAQSAKQPEPDKILTDGEWSLWLGNMNAAINKRALALWAGNAGGAVVVAAEGLASFMPKWGDAFEAETAAGGHIKASLVLALVDSAEETRLEAELERAVAFIEESHACGRNVLVHCAQGKHRSAAVVCGYLMLKRSMSLEEAWALVKKQRPIVELTSAFRSSLQQVEISLRKKECIH
eukprot:gnl/MRDRNA2_/MRDRNA2_110217_c0_seq1.p1 gnl/MRDRNA2_/MRDRNA2_110217_c0~~gnl/MRDRNA2_/MRDRNA2_110217_c0_seq1.p1  ORF type:complete len:227 (+),score=61.44 gnl/MRDRNA2_/MRDRNA2_110217_c0_seq1:63-743(+)